MRGLLVKQDAKLTRCYTKDSWRAMYVNHYDRNEKLSEENPTIGILLCTRKNDTLVRTTLPEDNKTILASEYKLYLPTGQQLIDEVNEVKAQLRRKENESVEEK